MDRVYALLVGIDTYQEPVPELFGCVNDVTDAQRYLLDAGVPQGDVRTLVDGAATKRAVVDPFRAHPGPVGPHAVIDLAYTAVGAPPAVFLRLDSTATRPLHCVLLNLTDRFGIDAGMFPGGFLDAGASAAAGDGDRFDLRIPADRLTAPCPMVQDWLMLIVSEDRIDPESFTLTRLGTPDRRADRGAAALAGIAEHLALGVHTRDAVRRPRTAGDWWTSVVRIVTRKPNGGASCH